MALFSGQPDPLITIYGAQRGAGNFSIKLEYYNSSKMLSEDDDQIKRLIQTRRGNRSAITRLEREVLQAKDAVLTPNLLARINSISASVSQKQKYLAELDEKILEKIPLEQIEREIDEAMEWTVKATEIVNLIEEIKKYRPKREQDLNTTNHPAEVTASVPGETDSSNDKATSPHNHSFSSVSSTQGVRLPKLELPKFNGDITEFNSFWQAFDCAIHSNESLPDVHKLNYLITRRSRSSCRCRTPVILNLYTT